MGSRRKVGQKKGGGAMGGARRKEGGGLAKKEQGSRDQKSWEWMCEEQLGLVTMRHQVPESEMVTRSFQAWQTESRVLPNRRGEVGHGGGL